MGSGYQGRGRVGRGGAVRTVSKIRSCIVDTEVSIVESRWDRIRHLLDVISVLTCFG